MTDEPIDGPDIGTSTDTGTRTGIEPALGDPATAQPDPAIIADAPQRPTDLPDKFWDSAAGAVRTDTLVKSYLELERRMGERSVSVPDSPDGYEIDPPEGFEELLASDPGINARLHAAGYTQAQAALVYELAAEHLIPLARHVLDDLHGAGEQATLTRHFGGESEWLRIKPQIEAWGKANLGAEAFATLSTSADGIVNMHRMMQSNEPAVLRGGAASAVASEPELRRMMRDPRYWRDEDPAYVARIRQGFETLYPD